MANTQIREALIFSLIQDRGRLLYRIRGLYFFFVLDIDHMGAKK